MMCKTIPLVRFGCRSVDIAALRVVWVAGRSVVYQRVGHNIQAALGVVPAPGVPAPGVCLHPDRVPVAGNRVGGTPAAGQTGGHPVADSLAEDSRAGEHPVAEFPETYQEQLCLQDNCQKPWIFEQIAMRATPPRLHRVHRWQEAAPAMQTNRRHKAPGPCDW